MQKKIIIAFLSVISVLAVFYGYKLYQEHGKIIPFIEQLSKAQVGDNVSVQPESQKTALFVGSQKCKKCHEEQFSSWKASYHSKMIQDPHQNSAVIVADFAALPKEANFKKEDVAFTIGGKFKQRYMLHKEINGTQDYVVGNYQWNTQTKQWQGYKTYKDWYENGFEHNNSTIGTSKTCDGCHFTGYMSQQKRVEPAISCEACHGPASRHVEDPEVYPLYVASSSDPKRATEVCLQCHMRNRDKRMEHTSIEALFGDVRDYPKGYEPGKPLHPYKMPAPFEGKETGEFYGNGVGKKNRTQGNEFVQSMMYNHGITCINCHDPHLLNSTTTKPLGDAVCMKCHTLGSAIGPHQQTLQEHTHHKADSNGSSCIECHMPKTSRHLPESPLTVRSHMFGFITPKETKKHGVPNACNNCHSDKSVEWADETLDKWGMSQWVKQP